MPTVDDIATQWANHIDAGTLDAKGQEQLDDWLAADRRHKGAFLRAQAGLRWLDQGRVASSVLALPEPDAPEEPRTRAARPLRWLIGGAAAAAACLAVALLRPHAADFQTGVGEQRRVTLADGSVAQINTDSALDVTYMPDRRRIDLHQGEAWFQVAHNRQRPFEVQAGPVHVRATGTAFSVRRRAEGVQVIVSEGRVLAWVEGSPQAPLAIAMGEQVLIPTAATSAPGAAAPRPTETRIADALAWRQGEIALNGETAAQAALEFNRYSTRSLRVENPQAARYQLVGYFQTNQSLEFAQAVARLTHTSVSQNGHEIIIK